MTDIKNDIVLTWIPNDKNLDLINFEHVKGIVIGHFKDIKKENLDIRATSSSISEKILEKLSKF